MWADKVIAITGASHWSQSEKKTIVGTIKRILSGRPELKVFFSWPQRRALRKLKKYIKSLPKGTNLVIVGKSLGGIVLYRLLKEIDFEGINLRVVFVDAHGWIFGDGKVGPYGSDKRPYIVLDKKVDGLSIYQRRKWPMGCRIVGIVNCLVNEDHWSIVNCVETKKAIEHCVFGGVR